MRSRHVAVAVVGSAISVARPLVRQRVRDGAAELTHLFLGLRSSSDLPLPHEVRSWAQQGVRVVLCLSGPLGPSSGEALPQPELLPEARRAGTYVQQALGAALEAGEVPAGALVVAAGPDAMLADLRALERRAGEAEVGRPFIEVLTNV
jgi:NAD(P)H-flavin reductase